LTPCDSSVVNEYRIINGEQGVHVSTRTKIEKYNPEEKTMKNKERAQACSIEWQVTFFLNT
jgi:hypothetical protein